MRKSHRMAQWGFTVIEVLTILILIIIVAVIALSRLSSTTDYKEMSEFDKVKSHLRYAQSRAIRTNESWGIRFNSSRTYFLFEGSNPATPIIIAGEDAPQVTLSYLLISSAPQTITFDRFGSPGAANITIATSEGNIIVTGNTGFVP